MSALELGAAVEAGARAQWEAMRERNPNYGYLPWEQIIGPRPLAIRAGSATVVYAAAPLIEAQVRASIAAEFDTLAGMLTDAMERTTVPIDLAICQDRRAQMATAAQMVRGKVTP